MKYHKSITEIFLFTFCKWHISIHSVKFGTLGKKGRVSAFLTSVLDSSRVDANSIPHIGYSGIVRNTQVNGLLLGKKVHIIV